VGGDVLRHFQLAVRVFQVRGDAGRAERVVSDLSLNTGGARGAGSCGKRPAAT